MRIAVVAQFNRRIGGTESYLDEVLPDLHAAGHTLSFVYERESSADRLCIKLPAESDSWSAAELGSATTLAEVARWRPDVIYAHGRLSPAFERGIQKLAPSIYFAHDYAGTCISGHKTWQFPVISPCNRRFGAACMAHYFPHRCGGRSPLTMIRLFAAETSRLKRMEGYNVLLTHSTHMRNEYLKHGFGAARVRSFSYYAAEITSPAGAEEIEAFTPPSGPIRLLFVGRMEKLKGAHVLIGCLPSVAASLKRPVILTLAGDGPMQRELQLLAKELSGRHPEILITFAGWLRRPGIQALMRDSDLLVTPSLWPEPFGRVGLEAATFNLPVVAYAVGGVGDWLTEGLNGCLAPGNPPDNHGLAAAIVRAAIPFYTRDCGRAAGLSPSGSPPAITSIPCCGFSMKWRGCVRRPEAVIVKPARPTCRANCFFNRVAKVCRACVL